VIKKIFVLVLLLFISTVCFAVPRMVVGEMFTNTSSSPSSSADLALDQIASDCVDYLAVIRYHWWLPSAFDPFYVANANENTARAQFYNNNYVPRLMIDGFVDGGLNHPTWRGLIDNRHSTDSPLRIVVAATFSSDAITGTTTARIYNESSSSVTGQLFFVLTETGIDWAAPNGLTFHNQAMLDMIPDASGETVTIPAHDSIIRTRYFTIRDTTWMNPPTNSILHIAQPESCQVVVFIQNPNTKEIYQGSKAWLIQTAIEERPIPYHLIKPTQVYPNPFISYVTIINPYTHIDIYNASGRIVKSIHSIERTKIIWDGKDENGFEVNPGIYVAKTFNSQIKLLKLN
jgi:hypothetical protein